MASFLTSANAFFKACETGKGWAVCSAFATADAAFSSEALPDIKTLQAYTDWMKGLVDGIAPDSRYTLHSVTSNDTQVSFYATFEGTHTLPGGPVPPTNKSVKSDYVYIVTFDPQGKITNMSKVWNNLLAFKQFGWSS